MALIVSILSHSRGSPYTKPISFLCAILSCLSAGSVTAFSLWGPLFMSQLGYTQYQINAISVGCEMAMYLPVPILGLLCDRWSLRGMSIISGIVLIIGYGTAAGVVESHGPHWSRFPRDDTLPWPWWLMVAAFVFVGTGTSCMYLSAITTCAKNFGNSERRGLTLAVPIAGFGLGGMCTSLVATTVFLDPDIGEIDMLSLFRFLAIETFAIGLLGGIGLNLANDQADRDQAPPSPIADSDHHPHGHYGTIEAPQPVGHTTDIRNDQFPGQDINSSLRPGDSRRGVKRFMFDHTMWLFAVGFFFTAGPGECFINNLGTLIPTLYEPSSIQKWTNFPSSSPPGRSPAFHVSLLGITSTFARLFTGILSDKLAPTPNKISFADRRLPFRQIRWTPRGISRLVFLISFCILFAMGCLLLGFGTLQGAPEYFWIITCLVGLGYGTVFALAPIIVSVVWGVENFGTHWGLIEIMPALGAAFWSAIYSMVFTAAGGGGNNGQCRGWDCYGWTFCWMGITVLSACVLWLYAWKGRGGWMTRGIAV